MNFKEAFAILKCNESMDSSEIRKSYIDLVEVWHPDRFAHSERLKEKAIEEMKQINIAYEVVKDYLKIKNKSFSASQETYSNKKETVILVKCVNCGVTNRIPANIPPGQIIKCGKCGNAPYTKPEKSTKEEFEDIFEEIYKKKFYENFNKYKEPNFNKPKDDQNQNQKKNNTTENHDENRNYCAAETCSGRIQPDGRCNQCGKTLEESRSVEEKFNEVKPVQTNEGFKRMIGIFGTLLLFMVLGHLMGGTENSTTKAKSSSTKVSNRDSNSVLSENGLEKNIPKIIEERQPALPPPSDGTIRTFTTKKLIAPFEIITTSGGNYLVKISDFNSNAIVMDVFIYGGSTIRMDVPLGSYKIKMATGSDWYGYEKLFGPQTTCSITQETFTFKVANNQIEGYTLTLHPVRNGNLRTSSLPMSQF